jgi:hypothetical protein
VIRTGEALRTCKALRTGESLRTGEALRTDEALRTGAIHSEGFSRTIKSPPFQEQFLLRPEAGERLPSASHTRAGRVYLHATI